MGCGEYQGYAKVIVVKCLKVLLLYACSINLNLSCVIRYFLFCKRFSNRNLFKSYSMLPAACHT